MDGSRSIIFHKILKQIWKWSKMQGVWITAAHIPGQSNIEVDKKLGNLKIQRSGGSLKKHFLSLQSNLARQILTYLLPDQIKRLINTSWKPDADSISTDTFSATRENYFYYCFPPFTFIWQILTKIKMESAKTILITHLWPTQSFQ